MRILVTGATGKVGNAVARRLLERGDEVVAVVRDPSRARDLLPPEAELATGDVTDPGSLRRAVAGVEGVINCMGLYEQWMPDPGIFDRVNAERARNLVAAAREVYGPGPWQGSGLDGAIRDAIRRRLPALPPGGMTLAFTDDVARGHVAALDRGGPGERYILADGFATMREIVAAAVDAAGRGWVPPTMPTGLARAMAAAGEGISRVIRRPPLLGRGQLHFLLWQARADNSKARKRLGVEFTPWREGVRRTVRWMGEAGRI